MDLCNRLHKRFLGEDLPGWAKQAISFILAAVVVMVARVDFFEAFRGQPSFFGALLTGLILAGLASEVAHPAIELAKAGSKRLAAKPSRAGKK